MFNKIEEILKKYKLRKTNLRFVLLSYILKHKGPQSLQKIKKAVSQITSDRVTLYRELERLQANGVIEAIVLENEINYELVDKHHHHAICEGCGRVVCLPCHSKETTVELSGWQKIKHQVLISGLCKRCH